MIFTMIDFSNKSWNPFCYCKNFFFINFSTTFMFAVDSQSPGVFACTPVSCQQWGQNYRLAECAICGSYNSTGLGNSALNIQDKPMTPGKPWSKDTIPNFCFIPVFSLNRLLISFLSYMYNHLFRTHKAQFNLAKICD